MADAFSDLIVTDNRLVRKWGRGVIALQDYSAPIPETFFHASTKVPVLPVTAKNLGYLTPEGSTQKREIASSDLFMGQDLDPVRSDLESISNTLECTLGESSNAWVQAVYNGLPVASFPANKDGAFDFGEDIDLTDFPYYRVWHILADGVGAAARYRIEYMPRAKVTSLGDRKKARNEAEVLPFTFTGFKDPVAGGLAVWTMENGPGVTVPSGG